MEYLLVPCLSLSWLLLVVLAATPTPMTLATSWTFDALDPPDLRPVVDDSLEHILKNFNAYHKMWLMNEDDWDNLDAVRLVFEPNQHKRNVKLMHERKGWDTHKNMLLQMDVFGPAFPDARGSFIRPLRRHQGCHHGRLQKVQEP